MAEIYNPKISWKVAVSVIGGLFAFSFFMASHESAAHKLLLLLVLFSIVAIGLKLVSFAVAWIFRPR